MSTSRSRSRRMSYRSLIPLLGLFSCVGLYCGQTPVPEVPTIASSSQTLWTSTGNMVTKRYQHQATLLADGKILVTGGSNGATSFNAVERYDPTTGTWSASASMATARSSHRAMLLQNGKVLAIGALGSGAVPASVELYDPATNVWSTAASMATGRFYFTATLLQSGKVLVTGGGFAGLTSTELYDPATNAWSPGGNMAIARRYHTATLLTNGKVLVVGGVPVGTAGSDSAELYDPATNTWTQLPVLSTGRFQHTATLLSDGKVLVAGGAASGGAGGLGNVEIYNPTTNTWTAAASMGAPRFKHSAVLLPSGQVLVAAGQTNINVSLTSTEVYNPVTNTWIARTPLAVVRSEFTMTGLASGGVMAAGGATPVTDAVELFSDLKTSGDACTSAAQCESAFCVDGVCCASACEGGTTDCLSCKGAENGGMNGTCARIPAAANVVCRAALAGGCDVVETCTGSSDICPADTYQAELCATDVSVALSAMPPSDGSPAATVTVAVSNVGTTPAQKITTTITVPDGATIQSAAGSGWDCTLSGTIATCTWPTQGATQIENITLRIVPSGGTANAALTATAVTEPADINPANNTATLDQSLLSPSQAVGCAAVPTSTNAGGLSVLVGLIGLIAATLRRRRAH